MDTLKEKAIRGGIWTGIEKLGNQIISFGIGLILARLLIPEDYGLLGIVLVFIAIAQAFVDGGFSAALIRKSNVTDDDYSTVFWFNLIAAILFYIILFFSSYVISSFYNEPKLILLAQVIGINIILNSFGIIQKTILVKKFDFKTQTKISLIATVAGGAVGIISALNGFGVWSLVIQNISRTVIINCGFWLKSTWRPLPVFSGNSFKELFGFGSKLLASGLIYTISGNLYSIVIGKIYNIKSLGFYSRANQFQQLPVVSIYGTISTITFPALVELQDDDQKLKNASRSIMKLTAFILFPIMGIFAVMAHQIIFIVLTDKWLPSVPLMQLLCVVGAFYPLHAINLEILKVKGRSDLFLKLEILKQSLNILVIIICYRYDVTGLVWGMIALNFVGYYINTYFTKIIIDYGFREQIKDLLIPIALTAMLIVIMYGLSYLIKGQLVQLIVLPIMGAVFYIIASFFLNLNEYAEVKAILLKIKLKVYG
ncbi:MAG TPA: lipopolysaccharide biosynthesis protein [Bacteroidia bacterium]|nr:lipopolysaccharide biosynthesis protein [Bacteroidia bacterium]